MIFELALCHSFHTKERCCKMVNRLGLKSLVLSFALMMSAGLATATPVTVITIGDGTSRSEAVASALTAAVEQVSGLKIESSQSLKTEITALLTSEGGSATLSEDQQKEIKKRSGGIVSSYTVVSEDKAANGQFEVKLSVTIETFEAKGVPNDARRRVIVGAITSGAVEPCKQTMTVEGIGTAVSREEAIDAALTEGITKVTGATVHHETDPNAILKTKQVDARAAGAMEVSSGAVAEQVHVVASSRVGKVEILTSSGGSVKSYDILSVDTDAAGHVVAHVRMEVSQCPSPQAFAARLGERLTSYLTRSRRFAVLDRAHDDAYAKEMELIQTDDVPLKERVRLGQTLAADYVIVGKLNTYTTGMVVKTNALSGETVSKHQFAVSIDFQVIDIATRQVKWAGTTKLANDSVESLAEFSAQAVGEDITQTIYPLRAIKIDDPAAVVINQGGNTIKVGQIFKAYRLGEELKDPYSKETLGRVEQEIATLKITRVDAKVSYGAVLAGAMAVSDDVLLRRVRASDSLAVPAKPKAVTTTSFD